MAVTEYYILLNRYLKFSDYWRTYTQLTHNYLYEYFNGAFSNFEIDDAYNRFSFILFGHDCRLQVWTNTSKYYFVYEIHRPNGEIIKKTFEENPNLCFNLSTHTIDLKEKDQMYAKDSFLNLMDALIAEIRNTED